MRKTRNSKTQTGTVEIKEVPFRGSVIFQGVTIRWHSSRHYTQDPSGDWDEEGGDHIDFTANNTSFDSMLLAVQVARRLVWARTRTYFCPGVNYGITAVGIDETGHVQVQVHRDGVYYAPMAAYQGNYSDPKDYSKSGINAMVAIHFLRDICTAISHAKSKDEFLQMTSSAYSSARKYREELGAKEAEQDVPTSEVAA